MKKQIKTLGMGLILGATMITVVGCGSTSTDDIVDETIRAEKVESMVVGTAKGIGEVTDFSETYMAEYKDMNKHDYVEMMIGEMNDYVREELKREVEPEEIDDVILDNILREEIEKDIAMIQETKMVDEYIYDDEEMEEEIVEAQLDITGREVEEIMNGYIYNNYPGYSGGNMYFENNKVYKNVLDDNGVSIATIEMDYLNTGIITVCQ